MCVSTAKVRWRPCAVLLLMVVVMEGGAELRAAEATENKMETPDAIFSGKTIVYNTRTFNASESKRSITNVLFEATTKAPKMALESPEKQFPSTKSQRVIRSAGTKSVTTPNIKPTSHEDGLLESSHSSKRDYDPIDTNEVDDDDYYRRIQPTRTTNDQHNVVGDVSSTTLNEMSGEGRRAPRILKSLLFSEPMNNTDSAYGKTLNASKVEEEQVTTQSATSRGSQNRKTNPDIQDIITGIVKLLNGNVKVQASPNLPPGVLPNGRPMRPLSTRINNRGPPRITDVPLDFDPPPPPPQPSTRIPPPYPFDLPPPIIGLPPQPSPSSVSGNHPFVTGIPVPEQVVPLPNPNYNQPGGGRPHRPRPGFPKPHGSQSGGKRPLPPLLVPPPAHTSNSQYEDYDDQNNDDTHNDQNDDNNDNSNKVNKKPNAGIEDMEMIHQGMNPSSQAGVDFQSSSSENPVEEEKEELPGEDFDEESNTSSTVAPAEEQPVEANQPDLNQEELETETGTERVEVSKNKTNAIAENTQKNNEELNSPEEAPTIIALMTSSSSTVTEATTVSSEDGSHSDAVPMGMLEPSVAVGTGIGVAVPVLEPSMQEILTQEATTSHSGDIQTAVTPPIGTEHKTGSPYVQIKQPQESHPGFAHYPYRPRPGIVLDDTEYKPGGVLNRPIITAPPSGHVGEVFDVTVSAVQGPGSGGNTGKPFVYPVPVEDVKLPAANDGNVALITTPEEGQHFVSIDGKRTYINLFGSSTEQPVATASKAPGSNTGKTPVATETLPTRPGPPVSPHRVYNKRPSNPPIRIDTCIVGDSSTCDAAQNEVCKTESGVSSCHCRPGYSRRKHREPCRRVVSLLLSLRVDRLFERRLEWDLSLEDEESQQYQQLEYEASHAIDSAMSMTPFSDDFLGVRVNGMYSEPGDSTVYVNVTLQLEENSETLRPAVRHDIQRHLLGVIHRRGNNVGHSALWVDTPATAISNVQDVNECSSRDLHDCHLQALCSNVFGSFRCACNVGLRDPWEGNPHRSGRQCESCPPEHCNGRGDCHFEDGHQVCYCTGNFYGSQCEIDGEVLGVAVGASVAAVVIIALTLVCLCMWSRRWSREQKMAAGMGSPVFGYMATASSTAKTPGLGLSPYQVSLEDRLRWAQIAEVMAQANHYAQPEPMNAPTRPSSAMFGYPTLSVAGTLPPPVPLPRLGLSNLHGGAHSVISGMRTPERTIDTTASSEEEDRADLLGRNFHQVPRPKSRSSIANQSATYYDVDFDQGDIYGSNTKHQYPAIPMSTYTVGRSSYYQQ